MQHIYRLNLQSADFPLLRAYAGRTVVIPGNDITQQSAQQPYSKMRPKVTFCQNVMPTFDGMQSVTFNDIPSNVVLAVPCVEYQNTMLYDTVPGKLSPAGFMSAKSGVLRPVFFKRFTSMAEAWQPALYAVGSPGAGTQVTGNRDKLPILLHLRGRTFIFLPEQSMCEWDTISAFVDRVPSSVLIGGAPTQKPIIGALVFGDYMIFYSENLIYWSNPADPLDFVPSLITGAGFGSPSGLDSSIIACYRSYNGFIIYTTTGAISATFSGNSQFPWIFKDIAGSTGLMDAEGAVHSYTDAFNYAATASGFVRMSAQGTEVVFPEVWDFLNAGILEEHTGLTITATPAQLRYRMQRVGSRYFVISYGLAIATAFTYALVYDVALQRWGKLRLPHAYVSIAPTMAVGMPARDNSLMFLAESGKLSIIDSTDTAVFNPAHYKASLLIGGISFTRDTVSTLMEVKADSGGRPITVLDLPSMDAVTLGAQVVLPPAVDGHYPCRISALQHNVEFRGDFHLVNVQITTMQAGVR